MHELECSLSSFLICLHLSANTFCEPQKVVFSLCGGLQETSESQALPPSIAECIHVHLSTDDSGEPQTLHGPIHGLGSDALI